MIDFPSAFLILAAEEQPPSWLMWVPLAAIVGFYYLFVLKPGSAERQREKEALASLKKNDRVITVGGIIGTIADLTNDDEVTLKVDDGTRMKFRRSAIQGPYSGASEKK